MLPRALPLLLLQLVWGHTPAAIFRYPLYDGCDAVTGDVMFHVENGVPQLIMNLANLTSNATGYVQIRNGVNCFDHFQIGGMWNGDAERAYPFNADANGVVSKTVNYTNVTLDSLMGRSVVILLENENGTTRRIGCGNIGLGYPATLSGYPGITQRIQGSIAVTGPLSAPAASSQHASGLVQLVFAINGLTASSAGNIRVYSGGTCGNVAGIGEVWGTNWTSRYVADASGSAIGNADISNVSPTRGVADYMNHVVVIFDASDNPLSCAVLGCPTQSREQGFENGMTTQRGKCVPTAVWVGSTVVAGNFFSGRSPVQVQVSGVGFQLRYGDVRSYPACAPKGQSVTLSYFLQSGTLVESVSAGVFEPVAEEKRVVVLSDRQPESVGRLDNNFALLFNQSKSPNVHDVVHLGVGLEDIIFRVASTGHRSEVRLGFGEHATITFPNSQNPVNTTVWVTNTGNDSIVFQKEYLFGRNSPNFVWFLSGWDTSAPDCKNVRNCGNTPLTVTSWPLVVGDYGEGTIPPVSHFEAAGFTPLPSILIAIVLIALF